MVIYATFMAHRKNSVRVGILSSSNENKRIFSCKRVGDVTLVDTSYFKYI